MNSRFASSARKGDILWIKLNGEEMSVYGSEADIAKLRLYWEQLLSTNGTITDVVIDCDQVMHTHSAIISAILQFGKIASARERPFRWILCGLSESSLAKVY